MGAHAPGWVGVTVALAHVRVRARPKKYGGIKREPSPSPPSPTFHP